MSAILQEVNLSSWLPSIDDLILTKRWSMRVLDVPGAVTRPPKHASATRGDRERRVRGLLALLIASGCDRGPGKPVVAGDGGPPPPAQRYERCDDVRACVDGLTCCGTCTDTSEDPTHCGRCDVTCPPGSTCVLGRCIAGDCTADCLGLVCCQGRDDVEPACVSLALDPAHCGGCHRACPGAEWCFDGECGCPLDEAGNFAVCDGECVDLDGDSRHCGGCGQVCPEERRVCSGGCTRCDEIEGLTDCGDARCTDLQWDPRHCGACARVCGRDAQCIRGTCVTGDCDLDCPPSAPVCCTDALLGPWCFDLLRSFEHCGGCGLTCASAEAEANACTFRAYCTWVGP